MKPRLLDLFCGAGGAAMGYARAGFEVIGVDIEPQPHYPFEFHQADALRVLEVGIPGAFIEDFDAIHASPPCQAYTVLGQSHRNQGKVYPDLVAPTREGLTVYDLPWIIENVPGSPIRPDVVLCGSMFGLRVRRHRWFECSWPIGPWVLSCDHSRRPVVVSGNNHSGGFSAREIMDAMTMPWAATRYEVRQAIPPAYTEYLGAQLLAFLSVSPETVNP